MADMFCSSFLDFRSPSTNHYKLHLLLPSKNFSNSMAHSFSTSISKINRKPLLCKPASPAIDVISTHEHSDGSIVFRFGDPSEVAENVELDKPVTLVEDIESEGVVESTAVKGLDDDHEKEVMVKEAEREVNVSGLNEVPNEFDPVTVVERGNESSDSELNGVPRDLVLEIERIRDDDNVQISLLPETSGSELMEPDSTESAMNSEEVMADFVLSSGAALLPHPSKVLTGGEDAYFVTGQTWLGVADGVLQWSLEETNPGIYAQDLIRNCENLASDCNGNSISYPLDLLNSSVAETRSSGCSTILLAQFDGQVLHVVNIGDSGFIILRHGTVYKRSRPMLHAFYFPMQIERDGDPSHLGELYQVDLEEDDVIITATDGLFDNLYDQEISSIVFKSLTADLKLEEIAELLATKAQEVGGSTSSRSPFADSAQAAGYVGYTGGKLDDVTVIVSVVQRRRSSSLTL